MRTYSSKNEVFENQFLLDYDEENDNEPNRKKDKMTCQRTSWNIVYLMGIFSLIQNTQYSIYLTTMWAYLKKLDPSATESQYGLIVAMSSLGHCFGCLLLGYWNGKTGKSAPSLYCGFLLMLASNIVYLFIDYLPSDMVFYTMMFSRLLGGFGMGNSSPMRTCASLHSTASDRSKAMASISGGRSVGTVVGPGLQLVFLPLGETGIQLLLNLSLHSNNAPAYLGIFLTMIGFLSLIVLFDEDEESEEIDKLAIADYDHHYRTVEVQSIYPEPDKLAMFICMLTRFVQNFMQIAIESLSQIMFMMMFLQSREQAVATMATTYLSTGLIATILYLMIIFTSLSKYVKDKIFNTGVLLVFIAHLLCTYSWPFYKENVEIIDHNFSNSSEAVLGCDSAALSWCQDLTVIPEWIFYAGYICSFGLFMPFINVANATLYSKLLNPDSQGTHQSLYDISNTIARIFAPILITLIYTAYGPRRAWEFMILLLTITASLWIAFDKRLVPLKPIKTKNIFENDGFSLPNEKIV